MSETESPNPTPDVVVQAETTPPQPQEPQTKNMGQILKAMPRLTEEEVKRIDEAMERARGRTNYAAVLLNMKQRDVEVKIHNNDVLRHRWSRSGFIPNEAQTLHRKRRKLRNSDPFGNLPGLVPCDKDQIARAFREEQDMFRDGLMNAGLNNKQVELAIQAQRVARTNFRGCLEAVHGTVTTNVFNLAIEKQECMKRLDELRVKLSEFNGTYGLGTPARACLLEEEKDLARQMREIDALLIKCKEVTDNGVLTLALASRRKQKRDKPGFKPTGAINV